MNQNFTWMIIKLFGDRDFLDLDFLPFQLIQLITFYLIM